MSLPIDPAAAAPPPPPAVRTADLTKRYGAHTALAGANVEVPAGAVCGLIGPNGAGKSTFLSIIATLLRPSGGWAQVFGINLSDARAIRPLVGYVPDVLGTYSGVTVQEYLLFFADAYNLPRDGRSDLIDSLLELVDLESKRSADVNTLSRGMKQRIGLARGLIHEPKLLLLDEPASGLDPRARAELREILIHLNFRGVTILTSSHNLPDLEEMCSHILVIEAGRVVGLETLHHSSSIRVEVAYLDGSREIFEVANTNEQAGLVYQLVMAGRHVVSVGEEGSALERRFMELTRGEVN